MKENQELMYAVFKHLEAGLPLKTAAEKAYRKYGRPELYPLIGYSLSGTKYQQEMLKLKIQKENGFATIGMSRTQYNILKAEKENV